MTKTSTEAVRRRLGPVGVWINTVGYGVTPADIERRELARIERLGYGSAWTGEGIGSKDAFAHHGIYLAATKQSVVGTGVANVWARPPVTMQAAAATLAEAYPGRFLLGIGIGHAYQAESVDDSYSRPLSRMRDYLTAMDDASDGPLVPNVEFPRVLGAIGPRMLELARDRADGAHPFSTTVEHTALARGVLGPDKLLIPYLPVMVEPDPGRARPAIRERFALATQVPAYAASFRRLGYTEADIAGPSDRLVDDTHAWGDDQAILDRVRAHLRAGADHVLITPAADNLPAAVDQLEHLAPALVGVSA